MRAVVQRVSSASVTVEGQTVGAIQHGFLILLGVEEEDTQRWWFGFLMTIAFIIACASLVYIVLRVTKQKELAKVTPEENNEALL